MTVSSGVEASRTWWGGRHVSAQIPGVLDFIWAGDLQKLSLGPRFPPFIFRFVYFSLFYIVPIKQRSRADPQGSSVDVWLVADLAVMAQQEAIQLSFLPHVGASDWTSSVSDGDPRRGFSAAPRLHHHGGGV